MKQCVQIGKVRLLGGLLLGGLLLSALLLAGCSSQAPVPTPTPDHASTTPPPAGKPEPTLRYEGPGHNYTTAIQLAGVSNPLAFSQKQQEWLWLNYRDWKKQGQALREHDGRQYDEVTLVNSKGETRVIYFRMPKSGKP